MSRWKYAYRRERIFDPELVTVLNHWGDQGWALIGSPRPIHASDKALSWDCLLRRVTSGRELAADAFAFHPWTPEQEAAFEASLGPSFRSEAK